MANRIWGVTGPSGAGKGEVCAILAQKGFSVIDTDALARQAVVPGSPCLEELTWIFSKEILLPDGSLNRRALAHIVFSDERARQALNAAVHPFVISRVKRAVLGEGDFLIDAPLLFESGLHALCSFTVAVLAGREERIRRITARDGISRKEAVLRIDAQPKDAFYTARADAVIRNDAQRAALCRAVEELL